MNNKLKSSLSSINLYQVSTSAWKMSFLICFFFIWGFLSNFPINQKIENFLRTSLAISPSCQINFQNIEASIFLSATIKDISIPPGCLPSVLSTPATLTNAKISFRGLSFSPFGPHFKLLTEFDNQTLELFITTGISSLSLVMKEQILDLNKIVKAFTAYNATGDMLTSFKIDTDYKNLTSLYFIMSSKNLNFPSQNIMGFSTPDLPMGDFLLKTKLQKNKLIVEEVIFGNIDSKIRSHFKGSVDLNLRNINTSKLKLSGELFLSDTFKEEIPLLALALEQFNQKDKFYQIDITGNLAAPSFSSPKL